MMFSVTLALLFGFDLRLRLPATRLPGLQPGFRSRVFVSNNQLTVWAPYRIRAPPGVAFDGCWRRGPQTHHHGVVDPRLTFCSESIEFRYDVRVHPHQT